MESISVASLYAQSKDEETISRIAEYISKNFIGSLVNVQGGNMDAMFFIDSPLSKELFEDMPTSEDLEVSVMTRRGYDVQEITFENGAWN